MRLDAGVLVCIAAALAFYFRLIRVQKRRGSTRDSDGRTNLIRRWPAAVAGMALAFLGALMASPGYFPPEAQPYWWVPVTLGFLVFQLAV